MLTTCPECHTAFRITHAQLESRRGMVRCGHCRAVFNAYDALMPDPGVARGAETGAETGATRFEPPAPEPPAPAPDAWRGTARAATETPAWPETEPPGVPEGGAVDEDDRPLAGWENEAEPEPVPGPPPDWEVEDRVELSPRAAAATGQPVTSASPAPKPAPAAAAEDSPDAILLSELPNRVRAGPPRHRLRTGLLVLASLLLFALVLAQGVYFLRGPLVATLPETRPALEEACRWLGCQVPLARQAEALRVESSSLETDPEQPSRAKLRVSLSNRSAAPQAWPHLLLKLTDPRGAALAQRAFKPVHYLPADKLAQAGLAPLNEVEVQLELDLGGLSAAGYEVRPHYP